MKKSIYLSIYLSINVAMAAEEYNVATYRNALPFNYIDERGMLTGFEYELLQQIATSEGIEIKIVPAHFPQVFGELAEGKIDAIGHSYYSKQREENYLLSSPVYIEKLEFIGLKENEEKIKNFDEKIPIYVATSLGSPVEKILDEIIKFYPNLKKTKTRLPFLGFKSLFTREADLLFNTQATLNTYRRNYSQYHYFQLPVDEGVQQTMSLHIMSRKDDRGQALIQHINHGLEAKKADGTYQRLLEKYHLAYPSN